MKFSYVDIAGSKKETEGWLNLFFGEECVSLIENKWIADEMRKVIDEKEAR